MSENQKRLVGVFVETAFTNEQVERAIAEEERLGIRDGHCAFLGEPGKTVTVVDGIVKASRI